MPLKFNPPPNWPRPPANWSPPAGWKPDPQWGPAPAGWQLWVDDTVKVDRQRRIFISYRRSDAQAQANGLYDGLTHRMPSAKIFIDIDAIPAGVDFEDHIRREIESCDLLLVVIGDNWLDARPGSDLRRIDEPEDFVRLEIESALSSERVAILPILVEGAQMPARNELPESIRALGRINAIELSDGRWTADMQRLATRIKEIGEAQQERAEQGAAVHEGAITPTPQPTPRPAPQPQPQPLPQPPPDWRPPPTPDRSDTVTGLLVALTVITCGCAGFAAPLWVALRPGQERGLRKRMFQIAGALGACSAVGIVVIGSSPTDEEGSPTSPLSYIGLVLLLAAAVVGIVVAIRYRKPPVSLPGTQMALARRRQREEYRDLIARDVNLARSIQVGRPDLAREYDDGGLLDLNSLTVAALVQFTPMSRAEAEQIVNLRDNLGRLSSLEEVLALAYPSEAVAARLRETAVFL